MDTQFGIVITGEQRLFSDKARAGGHPRALDTPSKAQGSFCFGHHPWGEPAWAWAFPCSVSLQIPESGQKPSVGTWLPVCMQTPALGSTCLSLLLTVCVTPGTPPPACLSFLVCTLRASERSLPGLPRGVNEVSWAWLTENRAATLHASHPHVLFSRQVNIQPWLERLSAPSVGL